MKRAKTNCTELHTSYRNMVVHVNIIEENRTQKTVLNYCAQTKAMLKYVQKSKEKLH